MLEIFQRFVTASARLAYIAGPELKDAIQVCNQTFQRQFSSTLGYWNKPNEDPRIVANHYIAALEAIEKECLNSYLSVKAPPLSFSNALVTELVNLGRESNIGIHFDSLNPEVADQTFRLIANAAQSFSKIGCTLPGRWKRSVRDANLVVDLGVKVRVVKGQWGDPEHPRIDLRQGYLSVVEQLAGKARHVAVATHDPWLARRALYRLQEAGTSCELELLFGLPMNAVMQVASELAVPVRLYIPYGEAYLPYALRQVRKKPQILWWFIRDSVISGHATANTRLINFE